MTTSHKETNEAPVPTVAPPGAPALHIRPATKADVPALAALLVRLKRLNAEFDPLLSVRPDAEAQAEKVLSTEVANPKGVVLLVEGTGPDHGKIVGLVRALVRERPFYTPESEGVILDIYLLPANRRHGTGEHLLNETIRHLREKGAGIVTAEFPALNEFAVKFYTKKGFRPVVVLHAKNL